MKKFEFNDQKCGYRLVLINLGIAEMDRGSVDQNSVDRNCVLSLDQNFVNHLTKFHLTESVDQNFKITQNDINKSFDQLTKKNWRILAVDQKF